MRIIVGADEAGVDYKNRILADLEADSRITEVIDIGVNRADEDFTRPYPPYVGIAAGEMIREAKPSVPSFSAAQGSAWPSRPTRSPPGSGPQQHTIRSPWNAQSCPTTARSSPWDSALWAWSWPVAWPGSGSATHSIPRPDQRRR